MYKYIYICKVGDIEFIEYLIFIIFVTNKPNNNRNKKLFDKYETYVL